jgi:D-arabinose 1-dehydrogenase-like Zn-dependent alcohol dehydrogenase
MNALTVRAALDELALRSGQTLGVTGAAGAVGGYAIQLARAEGLRVIAVRPFAGEAERGITVSLVLVFRHLHEGGTLARLAELAGTGARTAGRSGRVTFFFLLDFRYPWHGWCERGGRAS